MTNNGVPDSVKALFTPFSAADPQLRGVLPQDLAAVLDQVRSVQQAMDALSQRVTSLAIQAREAKEEAVVANKATETIQALAKRLRSAENTLAELTAHLKTTGNPLPPAKKADKPALSVNNRAPKRTKKVSK